MLKVLGEVDRRHAAPPQLALYRITVGEGGIQVSNEVDSGMVHSNPTFLRRLAKRESGRSTSRQGSALR